MVDAELHVARTAMNMKYARHNLQSILTGCSHSGTSFNVSQGSSRMSSASENPQPTHRRRWSDAGFTLLELLVVMVIIGLLAGYVGPRYFAQVGKSEVKVTRAQIDAFEKALDQYRLDTGRYPTTEQGLNALLVKPANEPKWSGPYLRKGVPPDPWGNPYLYRSPGEKAEYDLLSLGKDGQPGGVGEAADLGAN